MLETHPVTPTDERQALSRLAEESGWQRRESDRVDIYLRGSVRVHVLWRGADAISGGSRYEDFVLQSYTRDVVKARSWLTA